MLDWELAMEESGATIEPFVLLCVSFFAGNLDKLNPGDNDDLSCLFSEDGKVLRNPVNEGIRRINDAMINDAIQSFNDLTLHTSHRACKSQVSHAELTVSIAGMRQGRDLFERKFYTARLDDVEFLWHPLLI